MDIILHYNYKRLKWNCLIAILLLLFTYTANSQDSHSNYFNSTKDNLFLNHPALNAKDYRRSEQFTSNRSDINGSMRQYILTVEKTRDSLRNVINSNQRNSYRQVQFYPLGPSVTTDSIISKLGLVSALWIDTTDFQTIYAGSNTGGIFATYDGGQNWQCLSDNYMTSGVLAIEVDPKDKQHIYIGTGHWGFFREWGEGIMESFNGGETWNKTSLNVNSISGGFVVQDIKHLNKDTDTLIAIINTEFRGKTLIFHSIDRGATWHEVFRRDKEELFDIIKPNNDPYTLYAVGSLCLRSRDGGFTWEDFTDSIHVEPNHKIARMAIAIHPDNPQLNLAFCETYDTVNPGNYDQWLYRFSADDTLSFERIYISHNPFSGYWKMELQISPSNPQDFYLGGVWLYKFHIEGDSALIINNKNHKYHKDVRDLFVFKGTESDILFMGNDGGVSRSDNGSKKWYDITRNGMQSTQFYNIAISDESNMVYCGPQDGNLCFYNYDTKEWSIETHIGDAYEGLVDFNNPKNVYLVTYPPKLNRKNIFLLKSTDGGLSFNFRGVPDTTEQGRNNIPIAMDAANPKIIYAGLKNVWKSVDGAETWERISSFNPSYSDKIQALDVSPSNPDVICISFENPQWGETGTEKVVITENGGKDWKDITPYGENNLRWVSVVDILIHPKNHNIIYLALDRLWSNKRIYVTYDGGESWNNFSEGLPTVPINSIKYFKGADYDILFAATDAGIFYRDGLMQQWEIFGEDLPLTIISDIEINYKEKKLVAGTFGRGLWEAEICLPLDDTAMHVAGKEKWPDGKNLLSDLILMPGSELTMSGRIEVGDSRIIKIMPGAHLILDQATLTNNCKTLWQGIELYGNNDYYSDKPQGKISIINTVIENSFNGIRTFAMDESGNVDALRGGGIIYSDKSKFINVLRPVVLNPTTGVNPSKFILTEFAIKNPPWQIEDFTELIKMDHNNGIDFISCLFRNDTPLTAIPFTKRGIGINSYNSSFRIYKMHQDSVPAGFSSKPFFFQLSEGVKATTATPGYVFYSNSVTYKNNMKGCYLSGYSSVSAINNSFELTPLNIDSVERVTTGLYLDNIQSYQVNGNNFRLTPSFNNTKVAGIIINNCGELNNLVSNNSFDKFSYSIIAQNVNRNNKGDKGLRFLFNRFNKCEYDIAITWDQNTSFNGIAYYQGVIGDHNIEPAGNKFSNNSLHKTGDFHNECSPLIYSHYKSHPNSPRQMPLMSGNIWAMVSAIEMPVDSTHVPEYLRVDTTQISNLVSDWNLIAISSDEKFKSLIDGGDQNSLINRIVTVNDETIASLYSELRKYDSKLSIETLAVLLTNEKFPNTLLIEILVNNPVIFRNEHLIEAIFNRQPEFPDFMLFRLNGLHKRFSSTELYQSLCDNSVAITDEMRTIKLNKEWTEHMANSAVRLNSLLENEDELTYEIIKAFSWYTEDDIVKATISLEEASSDYEDKKSSIENLKFLMQLDDSLKQGNTDTLSIYRRLKITSIQQDPLAGIYAKNILNHFDSRYYIEPYILPTSTPVPFTLALPPVDYKGRNFRIYPQPASDYLIVDYYYESGINKGVLEFVNITGQVNKTLTLKHPFGQEFITVSDLHPGLYLVRLIQNSEVVETQKLLIAR